MKSNDINFVVFRDAALCQSEESERSEGVSKTSSATPQDDKITSTLGTNIYLQYHALIARDGTSLPARVLIKTVGNIGLIWMLSTYFGEYFILVGGVAAYLIVAALITLLNVLVRPLLNLITLPLKLFATILAVIVVNGVIIRLIQLVIEYLQITAVQLNIGGGVVGWIVVAILFGFGNWLMKAVLR